MLPERMDGDAVPPELLARNLREIHLMNRYAGGYSASLKGIKKLMTDRNKNYHIADLGCGDGGFLKYLAAWADKNGFSARLTGIDNNRETIRLLRRNCRKYPGITGIAADYRDALTALEKVDIFHCSLFCHHLANREIMALFRELKNMSGTGFVINDLRRSRQAFYAAKWIPLLLGGTSLSRHDGPVSVLNGFTRSELELLLEDAGIATFDIRRRRLFRFLIVGRVAGNNSGSE